MDMDVTLRNAELSEATVRDWMERILSVDVGDGVGWTLKGIAPIRDDDIYGGYRGEECVASASQCCCENYTANYH